MISWLRVLLLDVLQVRDGGDVIVDYVVVLCFYLFNLFLFHIEYLLELFLP